MIACRIGSMSVFLQENDFFDRIEGFSCKRMTIIYRMDVFSCRKTVIARVLDQFSCRKTAIERVQLGMAVDWFADETVHGECAVNLFEKEEAWSAAIDGMLLDERDLSERGGEKFWDANSVDS